MRLALIAHHVAPLCPPFVGGVESLTWALARRLARNGHEVVCFAPPGSAIPGVEIRELALDWEPDERSRRDVSMPPAAFMAAHHAYQRLMLELSRDDEGFDLVHVHALHYLPVAMAPLLPMPVLLTLHTPPTPWLRSALDAHLPGTLRLSAVSRATARMWSPLAIDDVVPNGVDVDAWPAGPGGDGAAWAGRIVPEKAPHLAIEAARRAGLDLRLAGPIVDHDYWEREVQPRLGAGATYLGHLDHAALADLFGTSAVALASPVWDEPFGLVAAEAMATGTPVAAFDRGGLGDVVGRAGGQLGPAGTDGRMPGAGGRLGAAAGRRDATAGVDGRLATAGGRLAPAGDVDALAAAAVEAARLDRRAVRSYARKHLGIAAMARGYERLYTRVAYEAQGAPVAGPSLDGPGLEPILREQQP